MLTHESPCDPNTMSVQADIAEIEAWIRCREAPLFQTQYLQAFSQLKAPRTTPNKRIGRKPLPLAQHLRIVNRKQIK